MIGVIRRASKPAAASEAGTADLRRLITLVQQSAATGVARHALLLRLSRLPEELVRPHHLRLAHDALMPLIGSGYANWFALPNEDVVVIWRGDAAAQLQECLATVRHLFADDARLADDPETLIERLDLPADAARLLQAAEHSLRAAASAQPAPREVRALDPAGLAFLETALSQASIDRFSRRRPVCAADGSGFRLSWEHRYLSVAEVFDALLPDCSPEAAPWLQLRLTRTLDRRLLAQLSSQDELRQAGPFGIELNVSSILAPEFLRFDALLPARLRGQVVLGLRPVDVMADPAAFLFARDFVRAQGYRVALTGVTAAQLKLFPLARVGLDLLQVDWSEALDQPDNIASLPEPASILLGRADTPAAIAWGRQHDVGLYYGRMAAPTPLKPGLGATRGAA